MVNLNRVLLIGNLTRDPELRYTPSGAAACEFSLAINRNWTDKKTGEKKEEVSFIDIVAWGRTAELCAEYLGGRSTEAAPAPQEISGQVSPEEDIPF